ncbi:MAG: transposase [Bacteroidota bacterium]|nr:transposase [Bacteroidota bacterium]
MRRGLRDGGTVHDASATGEIVVDTRQYTMRIVVVAHERLWDQHGQMLLDPEVSLETYWTNLPVSEKQVESVYHMHGTMEQYHAELKSDMGIERLPSGKFHANTLHLLCGMIACNLLRRVGMRMLESGKTPGQRGRRLRLRTVLQSVMDMAGAIVHHSGQVIVKICSHHAWAPAFMGMYVSFSSA